MPRLPSSADVPTVSPRVATDPGVQAPAQAFESPIGVAAQELAPAAEKFAEVALKQESRRDTVDRSSRINQFTREADERLRALNTESDLSDEQVLQEYSAFLDERRQQLLAEHGGSDDSRARLTMRLGDVSSRALGQATGISVRLGREKVLTAFDDGLTPLTARVAQEPTREAIDSTFVDLETHIDDLRGALDPTEEENLRAAGREAIALSAVDTLIARGQVETAASLIEDGGLSGALPEATQRDVRRRIEQVRFARDETARKIAQTEAVLGRPLTEQERLQVVGLAPESEELIEVGDPSSPTGSRFVPQSQAAGQPGRPRTPLVQFDQPQIGTIPPNFQLIRDPSNPDVLRMEPIPGSPADVDRQKQQAAAAEQDRLTARQSKLVVRDIDRSLAIIDESTLPAVGPFAGSVPVPGTPAFALERQLDGIKARVGFDQLQAMRAASPTGGALGQVSERENVLLQSVLGSLDIRQDEDILKENLNQIREIYLDAWFGTPEEHQAAIEDGRLTPEQVEELQRERETVGFDAIGRALDPEGAAGGNGEERPPAGRERPVEAAAVEFELGPEEIMAMSRDDVSQITPEQIQAMDDAQKDALNRRITELERARR